MISKRPQRSLRGKEHLRVFFSLFFLLFVLIIQSCKKDKTSEGASIGTSTAGAENAILNKGNPHNPPPPPPPSFYFYCSNPVITGSFLAGVPTNATVSLNYFNGTGSAYAAFTSTTVNGITLSAPAGTLNTGSGTFNFFASGTPVNSGFINIPISINGSPTCPLPLAVSNAPVSGPTADPGLAVGSTGIVNCTYKGQSVAYKTVRAEDGLIWLQQNLGSPQVAFWEQDQASFGDYFQWGRWDDGHQNSNSATITGGSTLLNPSNISSGNSNFIKGSTSSTMWWGLGGLSTDTWSGTSASSTNGKDPCAVLGPGWRLPTAAEWQNINILEDLSGTFAAFQSNLKLPAAGYRYFSDGGVIAYNGDFGFYWSSTAAANNTAKGLSFDNIYNSSIVTTNRGQGFSCRCVK